VADDPYGDEDLVALYDIDNPAGEDHEYYRKLADDIGARTIIDLGCGTGLLTRCLTGAGRDVVGIDPSATMLGWAGRQPGAERVRWMLGDASDLDADASVDLVVCSGNAIMHLGPEEFVSALHRIALTLRTGGMLAFETRNPDRRSWENWTRDNTYGERMTPLGRLREWVQLTDVDGGRVSFDAHNLLPDGTDRVYTSVLHFRGAAEIGRQLGTAGFTKVRIDGDWHHGPVTSASDLLVVRAVRG
jgi:SAM-dependent methyltransferase